MILTNTAPNDPLAREADALHRYLARRAPDEYVVRKYRAAHQQVAALRTAYDWFNAFLVRLSTRVPIAIPLVQAYTRFFLPNALIRKKAIVVLAIIECNPRTLDVVQRSQSQSSAKLVAASGVALAGFSILLLTAAILFGPLHAWARLHARLRGQHALQPAAGRGT